jgi:hypothetical protein
MKRSADALEAELADAETAHDRLMCGAHSLMKRSADALEAELTDAETAYDRLIAGPEFVERRDRIKRLRLDLVETMRIEREEAEKKRPRVWMLVKEGTHIHEKSHGSFMAVYSTRALAEANLPRWNKDMFGKDSFEVKEYILDAATVNDYAPPSP